MDTGHRCPQCGGPIEVTPSYAVVCREYGSEHLRIERHETDEWLRDHAPKGTEGTETMIIEYWTELGTWETDQTGDDDQ